MNRLPKSSSSGTAVLLAAALVACAQDPESTPQVALGPLDGRDLAPADTGRVAVGDVAPEFSLQSYDDGIVTLSEYRGRKDVILVFYRGWW
jgi:hypothetical protein